MSTGGKDFFEARVRVRYAETDQMGVAYYANYFVWFEIGRTELWRELGFSYERLESEESCMIPVVSASCRFRAPARYDDDLIVRTRASLLRGHLLKFHYRVIRAADDSLLAEGETTHVVTDREMRRRSLPERYAQRIRSLESATAD